MSRTVFEIYQAANLPMRWKNANEACGPCPLPGCGGEDRFILFATWQHGHDTNGGFYCRQCGARGNAQTLMRLLGGDTTATHRYRRNSFLPLNVKIVPCPEPIQFDEYHRLIDVARKNMMNPLVNAPALQYLKSRGLSAEAANRFKLGFFPQGRKYLAMNEEIAAPHLPVGIVIPNYRGEHLCSVRIRELVSVGVKYKTLIGCKQYPFIIQQNSGYSLPWLIVESDLDAILFATGMGMMSDLFNYLALGSAQSSPDEHVLMLLKSAPAVYFCPDFDAAGKKAYDRWATVLPNMKQALLPFGKDPTEAWQHGLDLEEWAKQVRGFGNAKLSVNRDKKVPFVRIITRADVAAYLNDFSKTTNTDAKAHLAIVYDANTALVGLSFADKTAVIDLETFLDVWPAYQSSLKLITFDSCALLRTLPQLEQASIIASILFAYHANTACGKGKELYDIAQEMLGTGGGQASPFYTGTRYTPEEAVAFDAQSVASLAINMRQLTWGVPSKIHYDLLVNAQKSIARMMRNGLPVDWDLLSSLQNLTGMQQGFEAFRDADSRLRTTLNPLGTVSGRFTSISPNLHSFPSSLKESVIAPQGSMLIDADLVQSEMRIAAELAHDYELISVIASGGDVHKAVMSKILGIPGGSISPEQRKVGKAVNFGFLYGVSARGLSETLLNQGVQYTQDQCQALQNKLSGAFPVLDAWRDELLRHCENREADCYPGGSVTTACGRKIKVNTLDWRWRTKPVNYVIQGSGADLLLVILSKLSVSMLPADAQLLHCIHDELLFEVREDEAERTAHLVAGIIEEAFAQVFHTTDTRNCVRIKIIKSWADAK